MKFTVWRQLPGTQGKNDCWARIGDYEAADDEAALKMACDAIPGHMLNQYFMVQPITQQPVYHHVRIVTPPQKLELKLSRVDYHEVMG